MFTNRTLSSGIGGHDTPRRRVVAFPLGSAACLAACVLSPVPGRADDAHLDRAVPAQAEVVVMRAGRECFTSLIHASGYLMPRRAAVVMFVAPGYQVTEVLAKVGDTVKQGDVLARLAAPGSPPADKAKAPPGVDLRATANGLIVEDTAFVGMLTSEKAKPLFTLAVDGVIEASVSVPSVHILELKAGQVARLTTRDGGVLDGRVRRTPATIDPDTQMGATRLSIAAQKGLELAQFVRARIEAKRSCGIGVPTAALRRTSAGNLVQIVKDDRILDRPVKLGLSNETDTEITANVAEGDLVVASAGSSREGDSVKPVFSDLQDAR